MSQDRLEVADVFRKYESAFFAQWGHVLSPQQRKAFEAIRDCRTAALGGHVEYVEQCEAERIKWVVHAKPPFGGPEQVLKYLARYTHRVAISNRRLLSMEDGRVTFEWKDYAGGNKARIMTLDAVEFIRRFLLHILPGGFVRIRQFGFLAN